MRVRMVGSTMIVGMPNPPKFRRDLTDEQNKRLRPIVRELLRSQFEENQTRFAKEIEWSQPGVSRFLAGNLGMSVQRAVRVCEMAGVDVSEIGLALPRRRGKLAGVVGVDFVLALRRLPALEKAIGRGRKRWDLETIVRALESAEAIGGEERLTVEQWTALLNDVDDDRDGG